MGLLAIVMTPAQAAALCGAVVLHQCLAGEGSRDWCRSCGGCGRCCSASASGPGPEPGLLTADGGDARCNGTWGRARALRHSGPDLGRVLRAATARAVAFAADRGGHRHRDRGDWRLHDPVRSLPAGDRAREGRPGAGAGAVVHGVDLGAGGPTRCRTGRCKCPVAGASLLALAPALAGMALGQWVRARVRSETFRICFFVGSLLLGAHLALRVWI